MWPFTFSAGQPFANLAKIREIREILSRKGLSLQGTTTLSYGAETIYAHSHSLILIVNRSI